MALPKGHTECYFSEVNRFATSDFELAKSIALDKILMGWKVGLEQTNLHGQPVEYTVYWGA